MPNVIVFDVMETLLDLRALDGTFERVFGNLYVREEWFEQMLASALVGTVTGVYHDFTAVGRAALRMAAARRRRELSGSDEDSILGGVRRLPPHPEARRALEQLRKAGRRLAALTNSTMSVAKEQLDHAGLAGLFDQIMSADEVQCLKPAPEPYRMAAKRLGTPIDQVRLVTVHSWDAVGAARAGCRVAFVARPGRVPDPLEEKPDIVGPDLEAVAAAIVESAP